MKKLISLFILITVLFSSVAVSAQESYITFEPYPYSTHVLGEDLTFYGKTNLPYVVIGVYIPSGSSYKILYSDIITRQVFKNGYTIFIPEESKNSPVGEWMLVAQYGDVRDEIKINMTKEPVYDRKVIVSEYEDSALTSVTTYPCRGMVVRDNVISFSLENKTQVKIFSWDNLAPTNKGESRIYVATYQDGYLTNIKTYPGTLLSYSNHVSLDMGNSKFKLFYWGNNLSPIE